MTTLLLALVLLPLWWAVGFMAIVLDWVLCTGSPRRLPVYLCVGIGFAGPIILVVVAIWIATNCGGFYRDRS